MRRNNCVFIKNTLNYINSKRSESGYAEWDLPAYYLFPASLVSPLLEEKLLFNKTGIIFFELCLKYSKVELT